MIGLDSYSRLVFNYLDPILIYISLWIDCLFEIRKIAVCFLWLLLPGHYRVTNEAYIVWPIFFLMNSLLLKELHFDFYLQSPFMYFTHKLAFFDCTKLQKTFGAISLASNSFSQCSPIVKNVCCIFCILFTRNSQFKLHQLAPSHNECRKITF